MNDQTIVKPLGLLLAVSFVVTACLAQPNRGADSSSLASSDDTTATFRQLHRATSHQAVAFLGERPHPTSAARETQTTVPRELPHPDHGVATDEGVARFSSTDGPISEPTEPSPSLPTFVEFAATDSTYMELLDYRKKDLWRGAISYSDHVYGKLNESTELPIEGQYHAILPSCVERETNFGSPQLVELLTFAARHVGETNTDQNPPRTIICNMAKEGGGRIKWSRSHASGRDADILFFIKDADGNPVEPDAMVRFGRRGNSLDEERVWTFDVERNWRLVRGLLTHPTIDAQWLFVSRPLRSKLLAHAREIGEPLPLLIKAGQLLKQPGDSTPHNDHFHLRVYCSTADRVGGCRDKEPFWPWVEGRDVTLARRSAAMALALRDRRRDIRKRALEYIESRRLYDASPAMAEAFMYDPSGDIQLRTMEALIEWGQRNTEVAVALEEHLRGPGGGLLEDDPDFTGAPLVSTSCDQEYCRWNNPMQPWVIDRKEDRRAIHIKRAYLLIGKIGGPEFAPFLASALKSKRVIALGKGVPEAELAAEASRHVMAPELVPALVDALSHEDDDVRQAAALALRRITNHSFELRFDRHAEPSELIAATKQWETWWNKHRHEGRDTWLMRSFVDVGVECEGITDDDLVYELISVTRRDDHLGYNADRMMGRLLGRRVVLDSDAGDRHARWRDWAGDR